MKLFTINSSLSKISENYRLEIIEKNSVIYLITHHFDSDKRFTLGRFKYD